MNNCEIVPSYDYANDKGVFPLLGQGKIKNLSVETTEGVAAPWCNPLTLQPEHSQAEWVRIPVGPHYLTGNRGLD